MAYVIESATHGVYVGIDWSSTGNTYGPRFRWSIKRSEGVQFNTLIDAMGELDKIKNFKHYAWKKQAWIDDLAIFDLIKAIYVG